MNIVLGASGQIGSVLVDELLRKEMPVRAILRNPSKEEMFRQKGADVFIADFFDERALKEAFEGGSRVFLLTPEDFGSNDVIADARAIIDNYKRAIVSSGIDKIVGLSTNGAQCGENSGNLEMSYMLEHAFADMDIKQTYIRPAYYYSNWLAYLDVMKNYGILLTFFPLDMKVQMIAPNDVSVFAGKVLNEEVEYRRIYELTGPSYSAHEVSDIFSKILGRDVDAQQIPRDEWENSLLKAGFSQNAAENMILMTLCVIEGQTATEFEPVQVSTTLEEFLNASLQ